jgi:outer membrane PBP1 activator LpoA protein
LAPQSSKTVISMPKRVISPAGSASGQQLERLDQALAAVADCLVGLSPAEWDELCREELIATHAAYQYWEATGWPEVMLPERELGRRILAAFARKYPHLAQDTVAVS